MLGSVLFARDQPDDASSAFKEALRLNPNLMPAYLELAKLALATAKNGDAIQYAQNAVQIVLVPRKLTYCSRGRS